MNSDLSTELAALAERLRRSTVVVRGRGWGGGSGVIWRADGLIVTNAHVVRGPRGAVVDLWDGRSLEASLKARDDERDLAALTIDASDLPAAQIGDSGEVRVGELVLAAGNPLGLVGAVATGIVSAILPRNGWRNPLVRQGWIRADVRLAPGNSGGPLADARGRVIGINSMVAGGLAMAIPSSAVTDFLSRLEERPARPELGLTMRPVFVPGAGVDGSAALGMLVLEVKPGSPAEVAGMLVGDVVTRAGGRQFETPVEMARAISRATSGGDGRLTLELLRGGQRMACDILLNREGQPAERSTAEAI